MLSGKSVNFQVPIWRFIIGRDVHYDDAPDSTLYKQALKNGTMSSCNSTLDLYESKQQRQEIDLIFLLQ